MSPLRNNRIDVEDDFSEDSLSHIGGALWKINISCFSPERS